MSPLVTCPRTPVPAIFDGSTPLSAASFRPDGGIGISRGWGCSGPAPIGFVRAVFSSGAPVAPAAGLVAVAAGAFSAAPAPSLIWPSKAPTATVSPFLTAMSESTPAAGAGTSRVTLSVSSSSSGSSTATESPACLNHLPTVASVTDSPSVGTRISTMTLSYLSFATPGRRPDRKILSQCLVEELLELREMLRHLPDCCGSRSRASGITHCSMLGGDLIEDPLQEGVDEEPGAHIARLFLTPNHFRLLEPRKFGDQRLGRERIKLLDSQDVDVIDGALLALIIEVVIDLARAHDHASDFVV